MTEFTYPDGSAITFDDKGQCVSYRVADPNPDEPLKVSIVSELIATYYLEAADGVSLLDYLTEKHNEGLPDDAHVSVYDTTKQEETN